MNIVTEWVMQIIVFILLGTIVELILPNNSMKKYVNIVIGLLLLLILAKPILYIFNVDVTAALNRMEETIFQDEKMMEETEILFENQKRDIQAEQDAYIWNEVKSQLMQEANPILMEQFSVQVDDVTFVFDDPYADNYDNLQEIIVLLQKSPNETKSEDEEIEPIIIESDESKKTSNQSNQHRNEDHIKNTLEELWGLNKYQITIQWEGGTS